MRIFFGKWGWHSRYSRNGSSHVMLTTALSLPFSQNYCVTMAAISGMYSKRVYSSKLQLQGCLFWGQIWEIWFQITLTGPKIFVWPFGFFWPFTRIDWPLARIRCDYPGSCLGSHIFSLFWLIDCRISPNFYILKVFDCKILLRP